MTRQHARPMAAIRRRERIDLAVFLALFLAVILACALATPAP